MTGYKVYTRDQARRLHKATPKKEARFRGLILKGVPVREYVLGWNTWAVWIRVNEFKEVYVGKVYQTFRYVRGDGGIVVREGPGKWYTLGVSEGFGKREDAVKTCYEVWLDERKGKGEEI